MRETYGRVRNDERATSLRKACGGTRVPCAMLMRAQAAAGADLARGPL